MGLDQSIYRRAKCPKKQMLNKIEGKEENEEVMYWRKNYLVNDWLCNELNLDNCDEGVMSEDFFRYFISWYENKVSELDGDEYHSVYEITDMKNDIIQLNKILDETDFDTDILFYQPWW